MKTPLNYQCSIFDCAPVTFINALSYLCDRHDIDPVIIKAIYACTLDRRDFSGEPGKRGTSAQAIRSLAEWITKYSRTNGQPLTCDFLSPETITVDNNILWQSITNGGVLLACVIFDRTYHYVLVTEIDASYVYLFDPYYDPIVNHPGCMPVTDLPMKMNRRVERSVFFSQQKLPYSLGEQSKRECVLMIRS